MEDCRLGPCRVTLRSIPVKLKDGQVGGEIVFDLPEGFRFGGVDSVRRTSKNWVEVLVWKVEHIHG